MARRLRKAIGLTEFAEVLGFDWTDDSDWVWNDVSNLVADLIEPSKPEDRCGNCRHFIKDRFMPCDAAHGYTEADVSACEDFSPLSCDREALLALAKVLGDMGDRYNEHERYELGTTFKAIAERIREALGVDDG